MDAQGSEGRPTQGSPGTGLANFYSWSTQTTKGESMITVGQYRLHWFLFVSVVIGAANLWLALVSDSNFVWINWVATVMNFGNVVLWRNDWVQKAHRHDV